MQKKIRLMVSLAAAISSGAVLSGCPQNSQIALPPPGSLPAQMYAANFTDESSGLNVHAVAVFPIPGSAGETAAGSINTGAALPAGVAVDPTTHNVFVSTGGSHTVVAYPRPHPSGSASLFSLNVGTLPIQMAFDLAGNLFVADVAGAVYEIAHPITSASVPTALTLTGASSPSCVAIDASNNLYTINGGGLPILLAYGPSHSGAATASTSNGMPLNGFLCTVNPATQQVFVMTEDACCPASIAGYSTPLANNEAPSVAITLPNSPSSISISAGFGFDSSGNLYVSRATFAEPSGTFTSAGIDVYLNPVTSASTPAFTLNNGTLGAAQLAQG